MSDSTSASIAHKIYHAYKRGDTVSADALWMQTPSYLAPDVRHHVHASNELEVPGWSGATCLSERPLRHAILHGVHRRLWPPESYRRSTRPPAFCRHRHRKSTQEDVLRLIDPPYAPWTTYYKGFNQIAWEWNFCDAWREVARFNVYFDAATGIVRRTEQRSYRGDFPSPFGRRRASSFRC